MRNLKKFLALVLAMMMALSLMVTVNAANVTADFSDAEQVTKEFVEAVDVTNGMGILKGYDNGTFKPGKNITRAEMTALVYRLATGDWQDLSNNIHSNYVNFKDVNKTSWYAGYVGYCENAEIIKGIGGGNFNPTRNVTGYEALAMILRAMGYDYNDEFTGTGWQVRVGSIATSRGILDNINNTNYAATLSYPATRELVAEMIFQAAQKPRVQWTDAFGYQSRDYTTATPGTDTYRVYTPLGELYYGLTYSWGIVTANQDTGEDVTVMGTASLANNSTASYTATNLLLDMETGLAEFGHRYKVWYDNRGGVPAVHKVYAAYDKVVKTQLVKSSDAILATATPGTHVLGDIVTDSRMGFRLVDRGTQQYAYFSTAFAVPDGRWDGLNAANESAQELYLVISNSAGNYVDLVVAVNAQINLISKVDNLASNKTVDVGRKLTAFYDAGIEGRLNQRDLFGNSCTKLNAKVVSNAIGTINNNTTTPADGYVLSEMTKVVTGTVSASHTGTDLNFDPDYVIVDGKKVEKSLLWYENATTAGNTIDRVDENAGAINTPVMTNFGTGTYRFYLDADGKYMAAERVYGEEFIYATYVDYEQATSTSTFNYYVTGVGMDGEPVTKPFNVWNNASFTGDLSTIAAPYRNNAIDTDKINSITDPTNYKGVVLSNTNLSDGGSSSISPADLGVYVHNGTTIQWNGTGSPVTTAPTIGSRDVAVGAVQVATMNSTVPVYLTNNSKIYIVSGNGTDTLKVEKVDGLAGLLGNSSLVTLSISNRDRNYFTTSDYYYANNGVYAKQIDTLFIPAYNVTRNTGAYFYGGTAKILNDSNGLANGKYALYQDGERVELWLASAPSTEGFKVLRPNGMVAGDGQPIYAVVDIADGDLGAYCVVNADNTIGAGEVAYLAATRNATVATVGTQLYNVSSAKVVNFQTGIKIESVQDLNEASTRYTNCKVFAVSADGVNIDVIYVMAVNTLRT